MNQIIVLFLFKQQPTTHTFSFFFSDETGMPKRLLIFLQKKIFFPGKFSLGRKIVIKIAKIVKNGLLSFFKENVVLARRQ